MSNPKPAAAESAANVKNPITPRSTVKPPAPLPYWLSPAGRSVVGGLGAVASGVCFGGYTALHTVFLDRYKDVVQLHKHGFPTPLTPDMVYRCEETLKDISIKLKSPNMINFFCVFGMDMFHAGSLKMRAGSIIGVPRNFSYASREQIEKQDIVVENQPVGWGSDGGQMLQDSLILSERAQKFGIAREIMMTNTNRVWVHGGIGSTAILTYLTITKFVNNKFLGLYRPKSFRLFVYSLTGAFCVGVWATATDLLTKYYENWADRKAGSINLEYAKGGVEFYSKILQRNMALRTLMGPGGEKAFTFYGNDVEFIRQQHVPYSERKKNLEALAEELSSSEGTKNENNNS